MGEIKSLTAYIGKILNGTSEEKEGLKQTFFKIADTMPFLQELGLKGDYFTVRYGVISHHKGKDSDHSYTVEEWEQICEKINTPVLITKYKESFNLYIDLYKNNKLTLVGVEVKQINRNLFVNNIKTVFAKNKREEEIVLWEKI